MVSQKGPHPVTAHGARLRGALKALALPALELRLSAQGCALAQRGGIAGATAKQSSSKGVCSPVLSSRPV